VKPDMLLQMAGLISHVVGAVAGKAFLTFNLYWSV